MHREMRRKDRQATVEETMEIIEKGLYGVLATADKNNMPYGVPLSYNYTNGAIYFHGAKVGHKVDNINDNNNVCFTIVTNSETLEEKFSVNFKSAMVFGKIYLVEDEEERMLAFVEMLKKYSPNFMEAGMKHIEEAGAAASIYKIIPEAITGKMRR